MEVLYGFLIGNDGGGLVDSMVVGCGLNKIIIDYTSKNQGMSVKSYNVGLHMTILYRPNFNYREKTSFKRTSKD